MDGPCPYCGLKVMTRPDIRLIDGVPVKIGRICDTCGAMREGGKVRQRHVKKVGLGNSVPGPRIAGSVKDLWKTYLESQGTTSEQVQAEYRERVGHLLN